MTLLLPTLALLAASGDDPAARHPAGSVLYLEVPDVPAALEAYGRTALVQTLLDPELHAVVGKLMGEDEFDPVALLEAEYAAAVERGDIPPLKELVLDPLRRVSASLSTPSGRVLPLVLALRSGTAAPDEVVAQVGVQVELELATAEAARSLFELLGGLAGQAGDPLVVEEHGETRTARLDSDHPVLGAISLVADGPRLCLLFGSEDDATYAARVAGEAEGFSASDPEAFTGRGTTVLRYHASFAEELLAVPELAGIGPLIELGEGLFGAPLTMLARGGRWRVGIDEAGRFVTEGLHARPRGPLDGVLASQPMERSAYALIHPDAIVGWAAHFDSAPLVELIRAEMGTLEADPFDEIEAGYGFRPERDLLAPLGEVLAYSMPEPKSLIGAPPLMLCAGLAAEDRAAFTRGMDGLGRLVRDQTEGDYEFQISEYRGMRLYSLRIDWSALGVPADLPIDIGAFFKPTLVVGDDRVLVTTLPAHAKAEIRRILSQNPRVHPLLMDGFPEGCTAIGFADWMRFVGRLYSSARAMAPMLALGWGEELPFDPRDLPPPELLTGRFEASRRWKRPLDEDVVLHFQESSFGPELPLLLGVGGFAAIFASSSPGADVAPPVIADSQGLPENAGPEWHEALARATELRVAAQVYHFDQGRWPPSLEALETSSANYPDGYLERAVGADPWGGDFHLRIADGRALVWCDGPNGVDEEGRGDDVVAR